jgi:hypothetical protein
MKKRLFILMFVMLFVFGCDSGKPAEIRDVVLPDIEISR